jgi:hypothetical protein
MRRQTVGADDLHEQGVFFMGLPTYEALSAAITPAANKYHILIRNDSGSAQSLLLLGLWYYNGVSAVTGVINEFRWQRQTYGTPSGGAAITTDANNSADPALAGVTIYGGATGGVGADGTIRRILNVSSEEHTATVADIDRVLEDTNKLESACPWSAVRGGGRLMPLATTYALQWFGPAAAAALVVAAPIVAAQPGGVARATAATSGTAVVTRAAATRLVNRPLAASGGAVITLALPKCRARPSLHVKVNELSQDDVVGAVQQMRVEGGLTLVEALRLLLAVAAGDATGLDGNPAFRSQDGSKTRLAASIAGGSRTITTKDPA